MVVANKQGRLANSYELRVEPIDGTFYKMFLDGRLNPKRGFNLHHESSYPGFGNYFSCILLRIIFDEGSSEIFSFVIGVMGSKEIALKVSIDDIVELWEGGNFCGNVKIKEIKRI